MEKENSTYLFHPAVTLFALLLFGSIQSQRQAYPETYSDSIKTELQKKWPDNRTVNLVFHVHSVPSGYLTGTKIYRMAFYSYEALIKVSEKNPYAVVNRIVTAIVGEQAEQGAKRFRNGGLTLQADVLFINYVLHDRSSGLKRAKTTLGIEDIQGLFAKS